MNDFAFYLIIQMVAKHGRMKNYCSVCRTDYEDYLEVDHS